MSLCAQVSGQLAHGDTDAALDGDKGVFYPPSIAVIVVDLAGSMRFDAVYNHLE